jgi:hypothetical protein
VTDADALVNQAVAAHGGMDAWRATPQLGFSLDSGGLALASKLQPRALRGLEASVATSGQHVTLEPYPGPGLRGTFAGGHVAIEDWSGRTRLERRDAREAFRGTRHLLWWDALDVLYFAGTALWTYLSLPFVLGDPGYGVRMLPTHMEGGERWQRLAVRFPGQVHTHSSEQVIHLGPDGLIRRLDYTAEVFGRWAKAANYCLGYTRIDGVVVASSRRVYPRRADGRSRGAPLLVWIELAERGH